MAVDRDDPVVIDPTRNVLDLVRAESVRQDGLRAAESQRINDLAAMRDKYEMRISDMLSRQVEHSAILLSTQVNDRLSKLEQFRYEQSGRSGGIGALAGWIVSGLVALVSVAGYLWKSAPNL